MEALNEKPRIGLFLVLAFAIAWLCWLPLILVWKGSQVCMNLGGGPALAAMIVAGRGRESGGRASRSRWLAAAILTLLGWAVLMLNSSLLERSWTGVHFNPWFIIPALIPAWIISGVFSKNDGVRDLLRTLVYPGNWGWQAAALFAPLVFLMGTGVLGSWMRFPVVRPLAGVRMGLKAATIITRLAQNFLFVALYEEVGWRGFLLPRLQVKFSPLLASLVLWLPWALWHLPLDLTRPVPWSLFTYLQYRVIFLIPYCILLTWIYNRSGKTILAPTLFHTAFGSATSLLPFSPPLAALIFVWTIMVLITDRMWRRIRVETGLDPSPHTHGGSELLSKCV